MLDGVSSGEHSMAARVEASSRYRTADWVEATLGQLSGEWVGWTGMIQMRNPTLRSEQCRSMDEVAVVLLWWYEGSPNECGSSKR